MINDFNYDKKTYSFKIYSKNYSKTDLNKQNFLNESFHPTFSYFLYEFLIVLFLRIYR